MDDLFEQTPAAAADMAAAASSGNNWCFDIKEEENESDQEPAGEEKEEPTIKKKKTSHPKAEGGKKGKTAAPSNPWKDNNKMFLHELYGVGIRSTRLFVADNKRSDIGGGKNQYHSSFDMPPADWMTPIDPINDLETKDGLSNRCVIGRHTWDAEQNVCRKYTIGVTGTDPNLLFDEVIEKMPLSAQYLAPIHHPAFLIGNSIEFNPKCGVSSTCIITNCSIVYYDEPNTPNSYLNYEIPEDQMHFFHQVEARCQRQYASLLDTIRSFKHHPDSLAYLKQVADLLRSHLERCNSDKPEDQDYKIAFTGPLASLHLYSISGPFKFQLPTVSDLTITPYTQGNSIHKGVKAHNNADVLAIELPGEPLMLQSSLTNETTIYERTNVPSPLLKRLILQNVGTHKVMAWRGVTGYMQDKADKFVTLMKDSQRQHPRDSSEDHLRRTPIRDALVEIEICINKAVDDLILLRQQRLIDQSRPLHILVPVCASNQWIAILFLWRYKQMVFATGHMPNFNPSLLHDWLLRSFPPVITAEEQKIIDVWRHQPAEMHKHLTELGNNNLKRWMVDYFKQPSNTQSAFSFWRNNGYLEGNSKIQGCADKSLLDEVIKTTSSSMPHQPDPMIHEMTQCAEKTRSSVVYRMKKEEVEELPFSNPGLVLPPALALKMVEIMFTTADVTFLTQHKEPECVGHMCLYDSPVRPELTGSIQAFDSQTRKTIMDTFFNCGDQVLTRSIEGFDRLKACINEFKADIGASTVKTLLATHQRLVNAQTKATQIVLYQDILHTQDDSHHDSAPLQVMGIYDDHAIELHGSTRGTPQEFVSPDKPAAHAHGFNARAQCKGSGPHSFPAGLDIRYSAHEDQSAAKQAFELDKENILIKCSAVNLIQLNATRTISQAYDLMGPYLKRDWISYACQPLSGSIDCSRHLPCLTPIAIKSTKAIGQSYAQLKCMQLPNAFLQIQRHAEPDTRLGYPRINAITAIRKASVLVTNDANKPFAFMKQPAGEHPDASAMALKNMVGAGTGDEDTRNKPFVPDRENQSMFDGSFGRNLSFFTPMRLNWRMNSHRTTFISDLLDRCDAISHRFDEEQVILKAPTFAKNQAILHAELQMLMHYCDTGLQGNQMPPAGELEKMRHTHRNDLSSLSKIEQLLPHLIQAGWRQQVRITSVEQDLTLAAMMKPPKPVKPTTPRKGKSVAQRNAALLEKQTKRIHKAEEARKEREINDRRLKRKFDQQAADQLPPLMPPPLPQYEEQQQGGAAAASAESELMITDDALEIGGYEPWNTDTSNICTQSAYSESAVKMYMKASFQDAQHWASRQHPFLAAGMVIGMTDQDYNTRRAVITTIVVSPNANEATIFYAGCLDSALGTLHHVEIKSDIWSRTFHSSTISMQQSAPRVKMIEGQLDPSINGLHHGNCIFVRGQWNHDSTMPIVPRGNFIVESQEVQQARVASIDTQAIRFVESSFPTIATTNIQEQTHQLPELHQDQRIRSDEMMPPMPETGPIPMEVENDLHEHIGVIPVDAEDAVMTDMQDTSHHHDSLHRDEQADIADDDDPAPSLPSIPCDHRNIQTSRDAARSWECRNCDLKGTGDFRKAVAASRFKQSCRLSVSQADTHLVYEELHALNPTISVEKWKEQFDETDNSFKQPPSETGYRLLSFSAENLDCAFRALGAQHLQLDRQIKADINATVKNFYGKDKIVTERANFIACNCKVGDPHCLVHRSSVGNVNPEECTCCVVHETIREYGELSVGPLRKGARTRDVPREVNTVLMDPQHLGGIDEALILSRFDPSVPQEPIKTIMFMGTEVLMGIPHSTTNIYNDCNGWSIDWKLARPLCFPAATSNNTPRFTTLFAYVNSNHYALIWRKTKDGKAEIRFPHMNEAGVRKIMQVLDLPEQQPPPPLSDEDNQIINDNPPEPTRTNTSADRRRKREEEEEQAKQLKREEERKITLALHAEKKEAQKREAAAQAAKEEAEAKAREEEQERIKEKQRQAQADELKKIQAAKAEAAKQKAEQERLEREQEELQKAQQREQQLLEEKEKQKSLQAERHKQARDAEITVKHTHCKSIVLIKINGDETPSGIGCISCGTTIPLGSTFAKEHYKKLIASYAKVPAEIKADVSALMPFVASKKAVNALNTLALAAPIDGESVQGVISEVPSQHPALPLELKLHTIAH